jgi:hypothetical protein
MIGEAFCLTTAHRFNGARKNSDAECASYRKSNSGKHVTSAAH